MKIQTNPHGKRVTTKMNDASRELEHILSEQIEGEVRFDPYSKVLYSTDASLYQIEPIGVVGRGHRSFHLTSVEPVSGILRVQTFSRAQ